MASMTVSKEELAAQRAMLQLRVTAWCTSFAKEHGREPTREDKVCLSQCSAAQHHLTPMPNSVRRSETAPTCMPETSSERLKLLWRWPLDLKRLANQAAPLQSLHHDQPWSSPPCAWLTAFRGCRPRLRARGATRRGSHHHK